jgi:hypothetical protein
MKDLLLVAQKEGNTVGGLYMRAQALATQCAGDSALV